MAAKKKYYAVRQGRQTGIFTTWAECEEQVKGYQGAVYRGFATEAEAKRYLYCANDSIETLQDIDATVDDNECETMIEFPKTNRELVAYVDGSFHQGLNRYAFGCVFLTAEGAIRYALGNGNEEDSLAMRNVAGEMLGAMYAVRVAMKSACSQVDICYDYAGIEQWAIGGWKTNKELTQKYAKAMQDWGQKIEIRFHKIAAHTNHRYNEMADEVAKRGLTEGDGIAPICAVGTYPIYETKRD